MSGYFACVRMHVPPSFACHANVEHPVATILHRFHVNVKACSKPIFVDVLGTVDLFIAPMALVRVRVVFVVVLKYCVASSTVEARGLSAHGNIIMCIVQDIAHHTSHLYMQQIRVESPWESNTMQLHTQTPKFKYRMVLASTPHTIVPQLMGPRASCCGSGRGHFTLLFLLNVGTRFEAPMPLMYDVTKSAHVGIFQK